MPSEFLTTRGQVNALFASEAPSATHQVLDRDSDVRDAHFGDGEEYHVSEPPALDDFDCEDVVYDDQGELVWLGL